MTNFNGSITDVLHEGRQAAEPHVRDGRRRSRPERGAPRAPSPGRPPRGYGFDKLKFDGVVKGGTVSGKLMVESRPPISGADPVRGMPRIEFEYCFAGRDYTLTKG